MTDRNAFSYLYFDCYYLKKKKKKKAFKDTILEGTYISNKIHFHKNYLLVYYFLEFVCLLTSIQILFWHDPKIDFRMVSSWLDDFLFSSRAASRDWLTIEQLDQLNPLNDLLSWAGSRRLVVEIGSCHLCVRFLQQEKQLFYLYFFAK